MRAVDKFCILLFFILSSSPTFCQEAAIDTTFLPSLTSLKDLDITHRSNESILYNTGFKANELPIFCKMEHRLQLKSRFPVRIRLGDVRYVNKLESKN